MKAAVVVLMMLATCAPIAHNLPPLTTPGGFRVVGTRIDVTVTGSGYEPARVSTRAGEPITLVFTRTSPSECGAEVVFPALNLRYRLPLNEPVAVPLTPTQTGELAFTCGMRMMKGALVVN